MAKKSARKRTTRKKPAARKTTSRSRATSRTKKTAGRSRAKTMTRKKTTTKKRKTTAKKTRSRATVAKKRKTTKKKTATTKKRVAKKVAKTKKKTKKAPAKKAPATKSTTKKTTKKNAKKPAGKKSTTKKSGKRTTRKIVGRSVAEVASTEQADAQGYVYVNGRRVRMISTGGVLPTRKVTTQKTEEAEQDALAHIKTIKTKLNAKDLRYYRDLLLEKRRELVGDVSAMEEQALQATGGNLSNLPIHMADIGSDTFDQDFMLGLAETERARLREIDEALQRVVDKTYGICQMTGKPIPKARLDAKPWAKYTIEAARKLEGGQWRA